MTKKINKLFVASIAVIAAFLIILSLSSCNNTTNTLDKYYNATWNRGGSTARIENSLLAYTNAIESGATCIHADMQMTKDGEIVLSHDPFLNPAYTYDRYGKNVTEKAVDIRTITAANLENYRLGPVDKNSNYYKTNGAPEKELKTKIPTLQDLLDLIVKSNDNDVILNLEFRLYCDPSTGDYYKNNVDKTTFVNNVYNIIKKNKYEKKVILSSLDWSIFPIIHDLDSHINLGAKWQITAGEDVGIGNLWYTKEECSPWLNGNNIHELGDEVISIAFALGCKYIYPEKGTATFAHITQAHDWEMKVIPWSLNTQEDMQAAWDLEVDGMVSDNGALLRSFLESKGATLPKPVQFNSEYHLD